MLLHLSRSTFRSKAGQMLGYAVLLVAFRVIMPAVWLTLLWTWTTASDSDHSNWEAMFGLVAKAVLV